MQLPFVWSCYHQISNGPAVETDSWQNLYFISFTAKLLIIIFAQEQREDSVF